MAPDLSRVRRHNNLHSDEEANQWIIRRAVLLLGEWLDVDGDIVQFKPGISSCYPLGRSAYQTPWSRYPCAVRRPVQPDVGVFSNNIRIELGNLDELRDSMKAWGWIAQPQFRALGDRRSKIVLIGHRRIAVAEELNIDWQQHIDWIDIGDGDAADVERFKLAIASNIGSRGLTPNDRKRIAAHLKLEHGWSQQKIAAALVVSQRQISTDLRELEVASNSKRGRPRKTAPDPDTKPETKPETKQDQPAAASNPATQKAAEDNEREPPRYSMDGNSGTPLWCSGCAMKSSATDTPSTQATRPATACMRRSMWCGCSLETS